METSKPGLGVAHNTCTPDEEKEMAAVPPVAATPQRVMTVGPCTAEWA